MKTKTVIIITMTKTNEKKTMIIKINEINEMTKVIRTIKVKEINETIEIKTKTKKSVNSRIRISIIIFIMRKFFAKRASTRE